MPDFKCYQKKMLCKKDEFLVAIYEIKILKYCYKNKEDKYIFIPGQIQYRNFTVDNLKNLKNQNLLDDSFNLVLSEMGIMGQVPIQNVEIIKNKIISKTVFQKPQYTYVKFTGQNIQLYSSRFREWKHAREGIYKFMNQIQGKKIIGCKQSAVEYKNESLFWLLYEADKIQENGKLQLIEFRVNGSWVKTLEKLQQESQKLNKNFLNATFSIRETNDWDNQVIHVVSSEIPQFPQEKQIEQLFFEDYSYNGIISQMVKSGQNLNYAILDVEISTNVRDKIIGCILYDKKITNVNNLKFNIEYWKSGSTWESIKQQFIENMKNKSLISYFFTPREGDDPKFGIFGIAYFK